ncbi:hypothetical protein ACLOJK_021221 [Asimina triloba]
MNVPNFSGRIRFCNVGDRQPRKLLLATDNYKSTNPQMRKFQLCVRRQLYACFRFPTPVALFMQDVKMRVELHPKEYESAKMIGRAGLCSRRKEEWGAEEGERRRGVGGEGEKERKEGWGEVFRRHSTHVSSINDNRFWSLGREKDTDDVATWTCEDALITVAGICRPFWILRRNEAPIKEVKARV